MTARLIFLVMVFTLAGCDKIEALLVDPKIAQRIADSKAIGSACRYGMRNIEDCYAKNEKASKAAMFDGWKEMDQYMRDNKIDGVPSKDEKPTQPTEEVIESKTSANVAKDKPGSDNKPKPRPKPADMPTSAASR